MKSTIFKKLNLKYKYLTLELEEVKSELVTYQQEFSAYIHDLQQREGITVLKSPEPVVDENSEEMQDEDIVPEIDKKRDRKQDKLFKALYNQICTVTHPDKTGNDPGMTRLFRHATKAKNDNNLMEIIELCDDLSIDVPNLEEEHINIIEKSIKKIQERINSVKKHDAWVWCNADDRGKKKIEKTIIKLFKDH